MRRVREDEALDKVFVIFNEFKTVLQQRVVVEQILPVARAEEETSEQSSPEAQNLVEYIYEQEPAEIFGRLLPRLIETQIFRALELTVTTRHVDDTDTLLREVFERYQLTYELRILDREEPDYAT